MKQTVAPFPRQLALYCAVTFAGVVAAAAALIVAQGPPAAISLLLLGGLAVFGIHHGVVVPGKRLSFSPNVMVLMAAVVVFDHDRTAAGAVLVGLASGLFLPALGRRTWGWMLLNGATWGCGAAAAALTYAALRPATSSALPLALIALLVPATAFIVGNETLVLLSYVVEGGRRFREIVVELTPHLASQLPFALLGFLLGRLYLSLGPTVMVLIIVPILIAREMFAAYLRVKDSHDETVGMLIHALEAKDRYTSGHSERVADYARYIGEELNFMPARLERLRFAALMHDIGKLVVPNELLNKPGRLTPDEFARVRVHEKVSVQMLSHIDFLRPIAAASHSDNTRFDPDDLDHPIEPYIVMIADAYDAMTSTRAYRKALPQDVAFKELRDKAGIQFHPACVEALINAVEKRGEKHGDGFESDTEFDDAPVVGLGSAGLGDLLHHDGSAERARGTGTAPAPAPEASTSSTSS
ncbi:MAG TPA: HD domain-containing phosphohydrolase [Acidimicrobiia bacterium]|nr:HD domain-containing phosphohydrolase [Acidimicrobiia bacterium]